MRVYTVMRLAYLIRRKRRMPEFARIHDIRGPGSIQAHEIQIIERLAIQVYLGARVLYVEPMGRK